MRARQYNQGSDRFANIRFIWSLFSIALCLLQVGCNSEVEQTEGVDNQPQPTWNQLVTSVRSGSSVEIRFTDNVVSEEEVAHLQTDCQELQILHLSQPKMTEDELAELLDTLPKLVQLKLTETVNDQQLQVICDQLPQLSVLNLPNTTLTDEGLLPLVEMQELTLFRFSSADVTDKGMEAISRIPNLTALHLINVPISDAGLKAIVQMEELQSFYLDGGNCSEEGLSNLVKERPDLHFHWNQLHLESDPNQHQH